MSPVFHFDGLNFGRQPFGSLVKHGDAYYFTTFAGGTNIASGFPNGAGTLGRLTFNNLGNPVVTKLIDLPTGYTAFPGGDVCPVGSNYLFFTTSGNSSFPGSLIRYDITNNTWSNVFTFTAAAKTQYGSGPGLSSPFHLEGNLYFTTQTGGSSNKGVVLKYSVADNTMTKLADLEGTGVASLGGGPQYHGGTFVEFPATGRRVIYMPIARGGAYGPVATGYGTILAINVPLPINLSISNNGNGTATLSWTGGYTPFNVESKSALGGGGWTTNLAGLMTNQVTVAITNVTTCFRVSGQSE
jgi:uncharacterized repeat protein (TIGR03803 family)